MLHLILIHKLAALLRYVIDCTHTKACRNCTAFLKGRKKGHHDSAQLTKVLVEIQEIRELNHSPWTISTTAAFDTSKNIHFHLSFRSESSSTLLHFKSILHSW